MNIKHGLSFILLFVLTGCATSLFSFTKPLDGKNSLKPGHGAIAYVARAFGDKEVDLIIPLKLNFSITKSNIERGGLGIIDAPYEYKPEISELPAGTYSFLSVGFGHKYASLSKCYGRIIVKEGTITYIGDIYGTVNSDKGLFGSVNIDVWDHEEKVMKELREQYPELFIKYKQDKQIAKIAFANQVACAK